MSVPLLKVNHLSAEDYLEMELSSPIKHEYVAGEIFAMTGTSDSHNTISQNLAFILREHLRGTPCRVFMSDLKLKVAAADAYFYPDLMVTCETAPDIYFREQPKLVVEVSSDFSTKFDREHKYRMYQALESLRIRAGRPKLHGRARVSADRRRLEYGDLHRRHRDSAAFGGIGDSHRKDLRVSLGLELSPSRYRITPPGSHLA
ncbi:Uma2 family endonuclease [Methylomonas sp. SURF-2]|uniref:Uma2 family endonuclease n=1 Tax=Methylomonas subterranea TaxID=2952225 RepID=A0ABT1TJB3_9GAMM|nr:Uma2 family endonuclease [Methylomonas sp. SURF-2]MCQ8105560.1 Uma2 family endonuclease [Methylomonas sp. SURF-2]